MLEGSDYIFFCEVFYINYCGLGSKSKMDAPLHLASWNSVSYQVPYELCLQSSNGDVTVTVFIEMSNAEEKNCVHKWP